MASSDTEQEAAVIVHVSENVHSPANSDISSSSTNSSSSSSLESDTNDVQCAASAEKSTEDDVITVQDGEELEQQEQRLAGEHDTPAGDEDNDNNIAIPSGRDLNGIITLTTSMNHSVASPPSSDPEDDMNVEDNEIQGGVDGYTLEERIHSISDPSSQITAVLQSSSANLWRQFDALGTEMIVTRRGR